MRGIRVTSQNAPLFFDRIQKAIENKSYLLSFQIPTRSLRKVNRAINSLRIKNSTWIKNRIGNLVYIEKNVRHSCISFPKEKRKYLEKKETAEDVASQYRNKKFTFLQKVELLIGDESFISIHTGDKIIIKPHGIFIEQAIRPEFPDSRYITAIYW